MSDEGKNDSNNDAKPYKKTQIPKKLRRPIWQKTNNSESGLCYCCMRDIEFEKFHAGHVIAEFNGGRMTVDNIFAICSLCNHSMGTMHMYDYIKILHWKNEHHYLKQCGALVDDKIFPNDKLTQRQVDGLYSKFKISEEQIKNLPKYDSTFDVYVELSHKDYANRDIIDHAYPDDLDKLNEEEIEDKMADFRVMGRNYRI